MSRLKLLLAACAALGFLGATAPSLPTGDDYRRLVSVDSPAISPNGKLVVAVVSRVVWDEDKRDQELVMIDAATAQQRVLTYRRSGLSSPAFSPDGTRLAFLANDGDGDDAAAQVFVMRLDGGDPRPVTKVKAGVDAFAWRPDGKAIAYEASEAEPERKGADRFRNSFVFTSEPITARSAPRPDHIYVQILDENAPVQLTFGPQSASGLSWARDGKSIAFTLARSAILDEQAYSHIAIVDVSSKAVRAITGRTMWEGSAVFSPDGTHLAYLYSKGDPQIAQSQAYVTTRGGGPGELVTGQLDRSIDEALWSPDSRNLIVATTDRTTNALYRVRIGGGAPQRVELGDLTPGTPLNTTGSASTPDLSNAIAADGTMAFVATKTAQPLELYLRASNGNVRRLTSFNVAMASALRWAKAERITFSTTTAVTGDGVLYYPPGFVVGKKYPVVVFIHGGPEDPTLTIFDFWAQVMAARGWLVLRPNYRGSQNLGLAYQRAIRYDPEEGPGKDIVSALDVLRARGIVDESRIGVCGWSYGGIMTAWLISKYHFWKVAVSGASVNDWATDYGTADDALADMALLHGSPFVGNNWQEYRRISAITYAPDVTTPVLILSDTGDNRDPFATSSMYYRALRDNGKTVTLRVWPIAGHFPDDPVRIVDIYHYWIDYLAQYLGR